MPSIQPGYTALSPDYYKAPYIQYVAEVRYFWDQGTLQIPVAGLSGQSNIQGPQPGYSLPRSARLASKVVTTSAPLGWKVVEVEAARQNLPPVLPDPISTDANLVLDSAVVSALNTGVADDGITPVYALAARYVYHMLAPEWFKDGLYTATSPALTFSKTQFLLDPSKFSAALL